MSIDDLLKVREYADARAKEQSDSKHEKEADHDRIIRLAKEVAYLDVSVFIGNLITEREGN